MGVESYDDGGHDPGVMPAMNPNYPFYQRPTVDDSLGGLQFQLDNTEIIMEVRRVLLCEEEYIDNRNMKFFKTTPGSTPYINEKGISTIMIILKSRLNKVMILSDLSEVRIRTMLNNIYEDLTDDFFYNWTNYAIKDISSGSIIVSMVTDTVEGTLRKAYQNNYLKLLRSIHSIQELNQNTGARRNQQRNDSGVLDFVKRFLPGKR